MKKIIPVLFLLFLINNSAYMQSGKGYSDYNYLSERVKTLAQSSPDVCSVKKIAETPGRKDINVLVIGTGEKENKPGIAVLAGVEGNYLLGREIAIELAESLVLNYKSLIERVTFYIFPDVSPDATEQYFASIRYERTVNASATDDDRDFITDEDPPEDLDKDGIITHIRIADPAGRYSVSTEDQRIMTTADITKGETGGYLLFSEGFDNDDDGSYNEDGPGGVNFNRNFTYDYEEFGRNAGLHPVSEPESKAVADFLYDRFNIFAVFTFGPQDNLGQPYKSEKPGTDRRITSIMPSDEMINRLISDKYHEATGLKGAPLQADMNGNFSDWAYYHYGRYSFSTPGWWFPAEIGKNPETEFLKYADQHNLKDVFIPWKEINHPSFEGKKVETGGIKPYVMINPPADSISSLAQKHIAFLTAVAEMHPQLEISALKTENPGEDLYRVSLKILNKGVFATMAQIGENNLWTRLMRLNMDLSKDQQIISGMKVQRIGRLEGGQSAEFSWLIKGRGRITITAGAVNTGITSATADLR